MMRSRVPNHIQAVPESASERAVQIQTVANPAGSVVPEPLDAAGEGRVGGRTDGQSSRLAGSRLPALCAPGRLPIPFVASACGKQQPRHQVSNLDGTPFPKVRPQPQRSALGRRQAGRGDLGNQPLCALQGRDLWLTASSGPRRSQDVVVVTVVLIGWGHPRLRDGHLGLLLLLHAAA